MRTILILISGMFFLPGCNSEPQHWEGSQKAIRAVTPEFITLSDSLWYPLIKRNTEVSIPYAFRMCEETGRIENFAVAAGNSSKKHQGERYNDTDVFKIIEGAAGSLILSPDPILESYVDSLITLIGSAQEEDGYLFTARSADPENPTPGAGRDRWTDVWVSHELYNAGHLYEAAVAYYRATGKDNLLKIALKNADLVCRVFGWGKLETAPGHQEIEIGLIKLYLIAGDEKYLDQARFFLDVRGTPQEHPEHPEGTRFAIYNNKTYLQQHLPVLEQTEAIGHAVRATYMYTAMTELARYLPACSAYHQTSELIWKNVIGTKIYLTGGVGASPKGEAFSDNYYLPNESAYNETCAAIGNVLWNQSLFQSTGESKYIDILERTLYNGLISGISQDGTHFFYPNPLASDGGYQRSPWFGVACCPGNMCRFLPKVPGMIYAQTTEDVYLNLFIASEAQISLKNTELLIRQKTDYPWNGTIDISVVSEKPARFSLKIRIPSWLGNTPFEGDLYHYADSISLSPTISLNGEALEYSIQDGYAILTRKWSKNDDLEIQFPMPVRKVIAHKNVLADSSRKALERGPIVYCLEEADNGKVRDLELNADFEAGFLFDPSLLGGSGKLQISDSKHTLSAIPYFLWANREPGEMEVWLSIKPK